MNCGQGVPAALLQLWGPAFPQTAPQWREEAQGWLGAKAPPEPVSPELREIFCAARGGHGARDACKRCSPCQGGSCSHLERSLASSLALGVSSCDFREQKGCDIRWCPPFAAFSCKCWSLQPMQLQGCSCHPRVCCCKAFLPL